MRWKRVALITLGIVVVLLGLAASSFSAARLPVAGGAPIAPAKPAHPPQELRIAALPTGEMLSRAAFAFRGGAFGEQRSFTMHALLVSHPNGRLLIDTGFGRGVDRHVQSLSLPMRLSTQYRAGTPAADQLAAAGIEPHTLTGIVLTHAHWDHVGGIPDMPGVPVWVPSAERELIRRGALAAKLLHGFSGVRYRVYDFPHGPYLGFPHSYDVFGDGSVVIVPAGGHTPGSVIVFVTTPDGKRYGLIGDLVWQREGLELPAERPFLVRKLVDDDEARVRELIVHLHRLQRADKQLVLVPAHDARAWRGLPTLVARGPSA